jgi:hypothetical protein
MSGAFQLEGATQIEQRLYGALQYIETQLGCGEELTALAVSVSDGMRELQRLRIELETVNAVAYVAGFHATMRDHEAKREFGEIERDILVRSLLRCRMANYPEIAGDPAGERTSGEMVCQTCKRTYAEHPMDWRQIGYGNVPFLNVLCDGRRVKL